MYVFLLSAFNKTVAITPYLKTIILDHIEEHKTYQISIQMASRTLNYGPPSTFNVSTHRPNRGKGETTNGKVIHNVLTNIIFIVSLHENAILLYFNLAI